MKGNNTSTPWKDATDTTTLEPSHNSLGPSSTPGYYLIRRKTTESSISPNGGSSRSLISLSARRTPSSRRSPRSGGSNHSDRKYHEKDQSINSFPVSVRHKNLSDWSGSSMLDSPSEYGTYQPQHPADPPRPARNGLEWVWFPDGYWAEREVRDMVSRKRPRPVERPRWWNRASSERKKSRSTGQQSVNGNNTPPTTDLPKIKIGSAKTSGDPSTNSRRSSKLSNPITKTHSSSKEPPFGFQFMRQPEASDHSPNIDIDTVDEQLGLYCRAKKNIRTRLLQRPNISRMVRSPLFLLYN